ncbi:MAG: CD1247 N-terminal domain-containing protein [Oscillospiraceae bacterium]
MSVTEKVAYLKGLMEGLGVDDSTKEGKVIGAMASILEDLAGSVAELQDGFNEMTELVDIIDEDLGELEEDIYGDECGEDCDCHDEDDYDMDDLLDEELYEVVCPTCGDTICINEEMLDEGEMECPNCGEPLEFDLDCDMSEGCDCGCDECGEDQDDQED